jgi:Protein of unknown function (DUF3054)
MHPRRAAICIDTAAVVVFVVVGRDSHSEGDAAGGLAAVAAPFAIGMALGWIASRRTTRPAGLRTGGVVWGCTAAVGLLLRAVVFVRPTPPLFMLVGATLLAVTLLGWRAIWALIMRTRGRGLGALETLDG